MSDSLDHISAAVMAARRRWRGRALRVTIGQREYAAVQRHLTYRGWQGRALSECPAVDRFMGYPLAVSAEPFGVWVTPEGEGGP
jgi:hypothetical protein